MKYDRITTILVFILLLLVAILIFLQLRQQDIIELKINSAIQSFSASPPQNGKDGHTPIKGVDYFDGYSPVKGKDYFDGKDGINGIDGQDGKNGVDGIDGTNGIDGNSPDIQCNMVKNRWEIKYGSDENWNVLGEDPIRCTITKSDILKLGIIL